MEVKKLLSKSLQEKPETRRASRKMGQMDLSKVVRMGLNENVFGMSGKAIKAMREATETSNYYFIDISPNGLKPTLAKIYGMTSENIAIGAGSSSIIEAVGKAFLNPGDEMVLCMPTFPAFLDMAYMNGAKPVVIPVTHEMKFDLNGMLQAVTEKTKMMIICNPNNPTGTYLGEQELKEFVKKVPSNIVVIFDEAYIEFAEASDCVSMVETMKEYSDKPIIVMKTFSKFYGMAGARLGYAIAQMEIITEISKCGIGFDVSKITNIGATAALQDQEHGEYVLEQVTKWRKYLTDEMRALGCKVYESQTNFIYFDAGLEPIDLLGKMLEKNILISASDLSRVSVGKPEDNIYFIQCLKEIIQGK